MIVDSFDYIACYKGLHPNLDTAIDWLNSHTLDALENGKTIIDGDKGKDEGAFDEAADCGFKSGAEHAGGVLGGGRFAIFFPGELHKPSCKSEGCDHVRKAVVKILMR